MSILIKGMEMPKSCAGCPTCREGTTLDGDYWLMCGYNGKPLESEIGAGKPDWCPLVPVPAHGRLIDADALIKLDRMVGKLMMFGGEYVYTQAEIDRAPTIIPAEEG